jgi:hypothetical protein
MVGKFGLNQVFIVVEEEGTKIAYQSHVTNSTNNGDEAEVATDLLNITNTFQAIPNPIPTTSTNASKPTTCF